MISLYLTRRNYQNFAKQEFVKKQIQVITDLVQSLHNDKINFQFTTYLGNGATAGHYDATIFEVQELKVIDSHPDYYQNPICFNGICNQLLNIKNFIDNPFLPKSIADELEKFYARNHYDVKKEELKGEHIIVVNTKHFETGIFERQDGNSHRVVKQSQAFALLNWANLIECSKRLETSIVNYLTRYKVKEINIRKDFKYV
jgi:hypothetical protein